MNNNQSIINVVKKQLNDFGQDIEFSHNLTTQGYFKCKALMTFSRQKYQNKEMRICISDMYKFVTLEKPKIKEFIYWNGGVYQITSIDNSVQGIYKNICKYVQDYSYKYELSILPADSGTIKEGDTLQLTPLLKVDGVIIADLTPYNFIWSSTNTEIATIDNNGLITGIKEGNTTITLTIKEDKNISAKYTITVQADDVVLSLVGDHSITKLYSYYDYVLSDGRTNVTFIVKSDNLNDINAQFIINTSSGVLSVHPMIDKIEGTLNVTVKDDNTGKILLTDILYVDLNEYSFSILNNTTEMFIDEKIQLKTYLTKNKNEVANAKIKYSSTNTNVATVDANGLVTGITKGEVTITAIAEEYSLSTSITTDVVEKPLLNTFKITNTEKDYGMFDTFKITTRLIVDGAEVTKPKIAYSSSNDLATVETDGTVSCGYGHGDVTITATATDYNLSDTFTFNIDF